MRSRLHALADSARLSSRMSKLDRDSTHDTCSTAQRGRGNRAWDMGRVAAGAAVHRAMPTRCHWCGCVWELGEAQGGGFGVWTQAARPRSAARLRSQASGVGAGRASVGGRRPAGRLPERGGSPLWRGSPCTSGVALCRRLTVPARPFPGRKSARYPVPAQRPTPAPATRAFPQLDRPPLKGDQATKPGSQHRAKSAHKARIVPLKLSPPVDDASQMTLRLRVHLSPPQRALLDLLRSMV